MLRAVLAAGLLGLLGAIPLPAQEAVLPDPLYRPPGSDVESVLPSELPGPTSEPVGPTETLPWQTAWGLTALRIFAAGPKVAPNGEVYHPSFSLDLNFNFWLWRSQRVYLFGDLRYRRLPDAQCSEFMVRIASLHLLSHREQSLALFSALAMSFPTIGGGRHPGGDLRQPR